FSFAEIIANKSKSPRGTKQRPIVRRLRFFEKGVRFDEVRFGGGAIAGLVVKLPDLFEAEGVIRIARLEGALREGERGLSDANRFRKPVARPQHVELVVENAPQLLIAFHCALPTLAQLAHQMARQFFGRQRQRLAFVRVDVASDEEARAAADPASRSEGFAIAAQKRVFHGESKGEFRGGK